MAKVTILTPTQQKLLAVLAAEKVIGENFYLTGGTALAEFYLWHRLSEDLDFFSENEIDSQAVFTLLKKLQPKAGFKKIAFEQSFNRNLFFLHFAREVVKTEFTFFPFPRIETKKQYGRLSVDSLLDIAVNKVFTIYQKPRSRDFIDLFCIIKKTGWTIEELVKKAKIKFDWHVDPLQLGSQFLQARILKEYPRMIQKIRPAVWQEFFLQVAKKLSKKFLK